MTAISIASMHSAGAAGGQSAKTILLFCSVGLVASICLVTFGIDLSAGWV